MRAYKGFNANLTCTMGNGTYQYEPGKTYHTDASQTARTGFHCCENPVDCLCWYGLPLQSQTHPEGSRIFVVEAAGDIDEIDDKIACTQLTLVKEFRLKTLVLEIVRYIINHPLRDWEGKGKLYEIAKDRSEALEDGIAIARGVNPRVKGKKGAVLSVLVEDPKQPDRFLTAKVGTVGIELQSDTWYTAFDGKWVEL